MGYPIVLLRCLVAAVAAPGISVPGAVYSVVHAVQGRYECIRNRALASTAQDMSSGYTDSAHPPIGDVAQHHVAQHHQLRNHDIPGSIPGDVLIRYTSSTGEI